MFLLIHKIQFLKTTFHLDLMFQSKSGLKLFLGDLTLYIYYILHDWLGEGVCYRSYFIPPNFDLSFLQGGAETRTYILENPAIAMLLGNMA